MWECDCGHIEYGELPPEECNKCWQSNSFIEVPEDMVDEMKDHILEEIRTNYGDDEDDDEEEE